MSKKSIFCLTPKNSVAIGYNFENDSIIAITAPKKHSIKIELDKTSFRNMFCEKCSLIITEPELSSRLKAEKILTSAVNKISYSVRNNVCTSSDQMLTMCPAGNSLSSFFTLEVDAPELLWIYNTKVTGKEQFKLFALKRDEDDLYIKPYLFSNVYSKPAGCISWPKNQPRPNNLEQAYNLYWDSPFSNESTVLDPLNPIDSHLDYLQTYDPNQDINFEWTYFNGDKINWLDATQQGIYYSNDSSVINSFPNRVTLNKNYILGTIKEGVEGNWLFKINNYLLTKTGKLTGTSKLNILCEI
jgi:hypothetical protein